MLGVEPAPELCAEPASNAAWVTKQCWRSKHPPHVRASPSIGGIRPSSMARGAHPATIVLRWMTRLSSMAGSACTADTPRRSACANWLYSNSPTGTCAALCSAMSNV
eukprot:scaffold6285_cov121-Isochrysis_galbana.AAC.5